MSCICFLILTMSCVMVLFFRSFSLSSTLSMSGFNGDWGGKGSGKGSGFNYRSSSRSKGFQKGDNKGGGWGKGKGSDNDGSFGSFGTVPGPRFTDQWGNPFPKSEKP